MSQMDEELKEVYRLFSKLILGDLVREGTSTSIKNTLANIYTMDNQIQTLRYSRLTGVLTFDIDRKLKSSFFRMYSMDSFELIFQCELYYGFQEYYRQIAQTLWAFQFLEGIIAFEFLNQKQGLEIEAAVKKHSHKSSEYMQILEERRKEELHKKREESFFGKIKNMFHKDSGNKKQESKIMNVRKENSITFDQQTGKLENIPPHLELAFSQLGFTKKQLSNKATAQNLVQDLLDYELIKKAKDDPTAVQLRKTLKQIGLQYRESINQHSQVQNFTNEISAPLSTSSPFGSIPIPPPFLPPPPPLLLSTPELFSKNNQNRPPNGLIQKADLLEQIRNGVKLKSVLKQQNKIVIQVSSMDKDQRQNMASYLRRRMKQRDDYQKRNKKIQSDQQS